MKSLLTLINELENKLPFIAQKKEAVSQATVGWHIEHSLLALVKMISAVEHSNPADYKWTFNIKRSIVFSAIVGIKRSFSSERLVAWHFSAIACVHKKVARRCCVL